MQSWEYFHKLIVIKKSHLREQVGLFLHFKIVIHFFKNDLLVNHAFS